MFTALYNGLALKLGSRENFNYQVSLKTVKITSQSIKLFLSQCDQVNESTENDTKPAKTFENYFKLIIVLDKYLNELIDLTTEDKLNYISGSLYSNEQIKKYNFLKKTVLNKINSMDCLFTWDLPKSKKDIISHIKKKYVDFNLDISTPVFTFERYISNIIIGYELFLREKEETAKILILLIGKWLEELDNSDNEFYLSISNGLKNVLLSTYIHMKMKTVKKDMNNHIQWLMDISMKYSDLNHRSEAAIHAIQAAVLLEYSDNKICLIKANKCAKTACDLDPTCSYWFYVHSLVLTAQRQLLLTKKSYSQPKENKAIQQAIKLSVAQNIYINYHEIILLRDVVLYNFYSEDYPSSKHENNCNKIVTMIKKLVDIEPNDPLVVVNCGRILISLPDVVPDVINYGKQLLLKGWQMAPNDLTVLKAITQIIIRYKKKIKCGDFSIIKCQSTPDQSSSTNKQVDIAESLKLAVEIHYRSEDPVPYLLSLLKNNENDLMQWKILAQICSYVVLFHNNLEDGVKYFKLLIEAVKNEFASDDLILSHYSSFTYKRQKFNLAKFINNEIKIALEDDVLDNKPYYYNVLSTILLNYQDTLSKDNVDRSFRINIIGEYRNKNEQFENKNNPQHLDKTRRSRNRNRSRSNRSNRSHQNDISINSNINEIVCEDDSDDERNLTISEDNDTDNCCKCTIM